MTLQYDQNNINLRDAAPVNIQTPDATPVTVLLDSLTADGQTLVVNLYGGGSNPADPVTDNYVVGIAVGPPLAGAAATYTRFAGAGSLTGPAGGAIAVIGAGTGATVLLVFGFTDVAATGETLCQLTITGPATPFNHQLRVSKIRF